LRGLRIIETRRARALRRDAPSAERVVWRRLRNRQLAGCKFVRQDPIGPYFADFVCREKMLVVEIDGATHSTDEEIDSDARRTAFLEANGFRVMRFDNAQIYENVDGALEAILSALGDGAGSGQSLSPSPRLSPRRGGERSPGGFFPPPRS
jgi:very-short-patch-repair endonuclease